MDVMNIFTSCQRSSEGYVFSRVCLSCHKVGEIPVQCPSPSPSSGPWFQPTSTGPWSPLCNCVDFVLIITVRNEVVKVMFLHLSVCPQGGLPRCMMGYHPYPPHPGEQTYLPRAGTPADQAPPNNGYCCERYASYWNAFLLTVCLLFHTFGQTISFPRLLSNVVFILRVLYNLPALVLSVS